MYIKVIIRELEYRSSGDVSRLYVSHKELLGTWEENAEQFSPGQTVSGIIRSIEEYGIFVELTPNLAGLAEYRNDVVIGQTAAVFIKNIIPERMKIKLVLIDSYKGEFMPQRMKYYLGENNNCEHIDYWRYSPKVCPRIIEECFAPAASV